MLKTGLLLFVGWNLMLAQQISPESFPSQQTERRDDHGVGFVPERSDWKEVFPIQNLVPKRKIGGLVRFNDPSFFYADNGKLVTAQGRFKRHRTFMFPHLRMDQYPYAIRVRMVKRDKFPVMAGMIFGAKTPYEFEVGSEKSHGTLFAYVGSHRVEFRDHRTYDTRVWKGASYELSHGWEEGDEVQLQLTFTEGGDYGLVAAEVTGAVQGHLPPTAIDLGKPDEITNRPHVRGLGYFGFAVHGKGEVEILEISAALGQNTPVSEGLDGYTRPCEWVVLKENRFDYITFTFALREAGLTAVSYLQGDSWSKPEDLPHTRNERDGGHTMYTHRLEWTGSRPVRYRLSQEGKVIYEGRIPPFTRNWDSEQGFVVIATGGNEVWRYKQQNQKNWFDNILTQDMWQGDPEETFGPFSNNMGDSGTEFMKFQGASHGWPDFVFGGDDYPGYPDNPILVQSEIDYQQRMWDVFAMSDSLREFHGNVPSAFKGGDHEFANSDQLQPGGIRGELYPTHIKNAYRVIALEGHTPIHPEEMSYISRPIPGWIEIFHIVTRFNQTVAVNSTEFPGFVDKTPAQSPSGLYVMERLEEWARNSPAPFKVVHQDHPLGDIRDVSAKESYRLYPWERGAMIRLVAEAGLIYAMGDEHNLRLVRYTDFSASKPADPRLAPLSDVSIYELGISNMSGEWFRHVRENKPSLDGFLYDVIYQAVPETGRIGYDGYQERNGYTVLRFNKDTRDFTFEIWQRNGATLGYRAKDPRRESPNFTYTIDPKENMWRTSMLPRIDWKEHGVNPDDAANIPYTVSDANGSALFSNRSDREGLIAEMPCPPLPLGSEVWVESGSGIRIRVTTE